MRNVQRTASCGAIAHDVAREEERCRSNGKFPGAIAVRVATQVAFRSVPEALVASGCEIGAVFFLDVAQQVLLAQQSGLHAFCTGASEMIQVLADTTLIGATSSAATKASETMILLNIAVAV